MKKLLTCLAFLFLLPLSAEANTTRRAVRSVVPLYVNGDIMCGGVVYRRRILTAAHCVDHPFTMYSQYRGESFLVLPDAVDLTQDLAVLRRVGGKVRGGARMSRNSPSPGKDVYAVGFPLSILGRHVTRGVVRSQAQYDREGQLVVYHDASLHPGNSGGGLFNRRGRLVGINSFMLAFPWGALYGATHPSQAKALFARGSEEPTSVTTQ